MAGQFVSHLLSAAGGALSRKTVARYASSLSSMWQWLMARGIAIADNNPWRGLAIARKAKRGEAPGQKQWSDAGIKALLSGEPQDALADASADPAGCTRHQVFDACGLASMLLSGKIDANFN
jgi:hypothetical protein